MNLFIDRPSNLLILCVITSLCAAVCGRINDIVGEQNLEPNNDISNLRYLAFGASVTWGATLRNRFDAYPYLLSNKAANLALRATGPNYPSICTQSMVGDKVYDVILIEYFLRSYDGLKPLAERLRKRFPNAVIIFVQLWNPTMIRYKKNGKEISMKTWKLQRGFKGQDGVKKAIEATSSADWEFHLSNLDGAMRILEDAAKSVNGYILKGPPFPTNSYENIDVKNLMLETMSIFSPDWFHLSKEGHRVVAQSVKKLLQTIPIKRSNEVGSWGKGDLCHKWYESGEVHVSYSKDVTLASFSPGKYALQFPSKEGKLRVSNPFEEARSLMLLYMTTGPAPTIYPKTKVKINNSLSKDVVIDPVNNDYDFPVHVAGCTNLGLVKPGKNVISITPLEITQQPFRVIAVALVDGDKKVSQNFVGPSST